MSDAQIFVSAIPMMTVRDEPSLCCAVMCFKYQVRSCYRESDDSDQLVEQYQLARRYESLCDPFMRQDDRAISHSRRMVSSMLDAMQLPFSLDRFAWVPASNIVDSNSGVVRSRDEIVSDIANFAQDVARDARHAGRKAYGVHVFITRVVTIPAIIEDSEVAPSSSWLTSFNSALQKMAYEGSGDDSSEVCVICLEELVAGSDVSCITGCSHRFHGDCIRKWLRRKDTCPTCRYKLSILF